METRNESKLTRWVSLEQYKALETKIETLENSIHHSTQKLEMLTNLDNSSQDEDIKAVKHLLRNNITNNKAYLEHFKKIKASSQVIHIENKDYVQVGAFVTLYDIYSQKRLFIQIVNIVIGLEDKKYKIVRGSDILGKLLINKKRKIGDEFIYCPDVDNIYKYRIENIEWKDDKENVVEGPQKTKKR